jgi:hypothetical protein
VLGKVEPSRILVPDPLHISWVGAFVRAGSGLIVSATVNGVPEQPFAATGEMVYTTLTGLSEVFVHASSAMTVLPNPVPVTGLPADAVRPLLLMEVME